MILFGHPTGNPNSFQAALAHYERNRLAAFVVPWMLTPRQERLLKLLPGTERLVARLRKRSFRPLLDAPRVEGRALELVRLVRRTLSRGAKDEVIAYEANDWLMKTMTKEALRSAVTAVHSYEDCSLLQFEAAARLGKTRIYDMPIGYYSAWQKIEHDLSNTHRDWLPMGGISSRKFVRPEQKKREMQLADIVLVPSSFVKTTIAQYEDKECFVAPYGVDSEFWTPSPEPTLRRTLRFIFVGQISLRKGVHVLIDAWKKARLPDAELQLIGRWDLATDVLELGDNISYVPPCSYVDLREHYRAADVFVFPSFFEGFGLVLLEAMACGLPFIASESSGAGLDFANSGAGTVVPTGDVEALIQAMRDFSNRRDNLNEMKLAARTKAVACTWENYRRLVASACSSVAAGR